MTGNCANKFQNKNLWGGITYTNVHNNVSYEQYPDGSIKVNGTNDTQYISYSLLSDNSAERTKTLPAGTYTLSGGSVNVILELCNSGGTTLGETTTTKFTKTITLGAETTIFVRARVNTGVSVNNEIIYIQLEQGSTATDYIPHAEQNAPLSLGNIEAYEGDEIQIDYVQKAGYKKVTGARFVKNNAKIASYNGETITTEYKSTTGQLTTGATVVYKLVTPNITEITDPTFLAQLETLINMKTYKEVTNIDLTGEDLAPVLDCDYYQDMSTIKSDITSIKARLDLLEN